MRYLPLTDKDRDAMLAAIGAPDVDSLFTDVPAACLNPKLDLPAHASEMQVENHMARLAGRNHAAGSGPFFLGTGAYRHHVPASVDHIIQRGEFLTAYTPYQPEIAQGTLQYIFEFQTQVARLTGMDVANASMYDGSTATAEAVMMASRITRKPRTVIAGGLHPHYRRVAETMTRYRGETLYSLPAQPDQPLSVADIMAAVDDETGAVVVQNPDVFGHVADLTPLADALHTRKALLIVVVTEVVSLGLMQSPGAMGADIVVCEGQSIGNGLNFGGPYVGLFATRQKYVRQMPGRLCGQTVDGSGKRGFVLTLSTREQHIRREKATSNICTNSGLCALAFTVHMSLLGGAGLQRLARLNHNAARKLAAAIGSVSGLELLNDGFFNEVTVRVPGSAGKLVDRLAEQGILAGVPARRLDDELTDDLLIMAATELTTDSDIEALKAALGEALA